MNRPEIYRANLRHLAQSIGGLVARVRRKQMRKQIVANDNRVRSTEGRPDFLKLAIDTIARFELPEPVAPPVQADPNRFDPCAPPSTRTAPQFEVPFRRAILFPDLCVPVDLEGKGDADTP